MHCHVLHYHLGASLGLSSSSSAAGPTTFSLKFPGPTAWQLRKCKSCCYNISVVEYWNLHGRLDHVLDVGAVQGDGLGVLESGWC